MVPISYHIDTTIDIQLAQLAHVFLMSSIHVSEKKTSIWNFSEPQQTAFSLVHVLRKKNQKGQRNQQSLRDDDTDDEEENNDDEEKHDDNEQLIANNFSNKKHHKTRIKMTISNMMMMMIINIFSTLHILTLCHFCQFVDYSSYYPGDNAISPKRPLTKKMA